MHLLPKTKAEWAQTILFPFKVHLAISFLIYLLIGAPREIFGYWPYPPVIVNICGGFIAIGMQIDFLAFVLAAMLLLARRQYNDSKKCFLFAAATIVLFFCAIPGFGVSQ